MYQKINEIVQDIENEREAYIDHLIKVDGNGNYMTSSHRLFINRLEYNLKEIKKICEDNIRETVLKSQNDR